MIQKQIVTEIVNLHKEGKTNKQIQERTGTSCKEVLRTLNRRGFKSNRYSWGELTHKASEFIFASLLGDGHFTKDDRLTFGHAESQKGYLEFKREFLLSENIDMCNISSYHVDNERYKNPYTVFTLKTCRRPEFKAIRELYFKDGHKTVPEEEYVNEFLTPFALAIWFMDDGNAASRKNLQLNTQSFSAESVAILRYVLLDKFKIRSTSNKENSITIRVDSVEIFINLIDEFVLPSMKYKYKLKKKE